MARPHLYDLVDALVRRRAAPAAKSGVLLVSSGGLGDTLLFSLVLPRFVALARPGEPVTVVVRRDTRPATFLFDPAVEVMAVDYTRFRRDLAYRWRTSLAIRARGFRLAVSTDHLRLPTVDDALVIAAGAAETVALSPRSWPKHDAALARNRRFYDRWVEPSPGMAHRAQRWTELANALTGRDEPPPVVRFPADRLPAPAAVDRPVAVLHPFSAIPERQHGPEVFADVVRRLPAGVRAVLSAAPGDLDRNPGYRALLDDPRVSLDESSLEEKAALLRSAALAVTVDTSLMHLAVGCGTPTLCLASAAHVVDSVPYDARMTPANVRFLYHDMPCRGCLGTCTLPYEDGRYPCVAHLDRDEVLAAVDDLAGRGATA